MKARPLTALLMAPLVASVLSVVGAMPARASTANIYIWGVVPGSTSWLSPTKMTAPTMSEVDPENSFVLALATDGTVWGWGQNTQGALGNGTLTNVTGTSMTEVQNITHAVDVQGGNHWGAAVLSGGTVWTWGAIDRKADVPRQLSGVSGAVAVAGANFDGYVLLSNGTVMSFGQNYYGQLCNGSFSTSARQKYPPALISGLTGVTQVTAGDHYVLFLKSNGTVWGCGINNYGQLGNGTTTNSDVPVQARNLTSVTEINAGGGLLTDGTAVALQGGRAYAWGANAKGQLCQGYTSTEQLTPLEIPSTGTETIAQVTSGTDNLFQVDSAGNLYGCGANNNGQMAQGNTLKKHYDSPVKIPLSSVSSGVAGEGDEGALAA